MVRLDVLSTVTPAYQPLLDDWMLPSLRRLRWRRVYVVVDRTSRARGNADFRTPGFDQQVFNKLRLVGQWATRRRHPFLVTDADVIYLRPFAPVALPLLEGKDLLLAREIVDRDDHYNIGQMLINPSRAVGDFFLRMAHELSSGAVHQYGEQQPANQDHINEALRASGLRHAALPETVANTALWDHFGPDRSERVVSYHATDTLPTPERSSLEWKQERLANVSALCDVDLALWRRGGAWTSSFRRSIR